MPLNTLRLNHQPSSHPNDRIVFIKTIPRPSSDQESSHLADTFLRAIAAQCLPIMRNHHLSVTTLEEHEWNREFIGRNFNNGEIIQLVLRGKNGGWLPFNMVQMVMMHELAHNVQMNHSKAFWQQRNVFAGEMRDLWSRGYTGEGLWGTGRTLNELGAVMENNIVPSAELEGLSLCGGTYRSRRRKRKAGANGNDLTWKEKRDRRIEKKFGKNGVALGEDEDKRMTLEIGRKGPIGSKPRVAQSKRGRELRAAAALARFETNKHEVDALQTEPKDEDDEEYEEVDDEVEDAVDSNGQKLLDDNGNGMVKVCEVEDSDDTNVKQEMQEMLGFNQPFPPALRNSSGSGEKLIMPTKNHRKTIYDIPEHATPPAESGTSQESNITREPAKPSITIHHRPATSKQNAQNVSSGNTPSDSTIIASSSRVHKSLPSPSLTFLNDTSPLPATIYCPICSMLNDRLNTTCIACAHVLDPKKDPRHWCCTNEACNESQYLNGGDTRICGVCHGRRQDD